MSLVQAKIQRFLADTESAIWWPGLAVSVIQHSSHYKSLLDNYSTASVISNGVVAPLAITQLIKPSTVNLEFLCEEYSGLFGDLGVKQISLEQFNCPGVAKRLELALGLVAASPSLLEVVKILVRSIHVIQAEPGFDVSFTDPALPFSIFVSIPEDNKYPDFRLAEAIIHEAMHLQLSIIEREVELTLDDQARHYSPWKKMLRPTSGIMHALYVFTVIKQWLDAVAGTSDGSGYAHYRIDGIREELSLLNYDSCYNSLTSSGKFLFDNMMAILKG